MQELKACVTLLAIWADGAEAKLEACNVDTLVTIDGFAWKATGDAADILLGNRAILHGTFKLTRSGNIFCQDKEAGCETIKAVTRVEAPEAVEMPEKHESGVVAVASTWVDRNGRRLVDDHDVAVFEENSGWLGSHGRLVAVHPMGNAGVVFQWHIDGHDLSIHKNSSRCNGVFIIFYRLGLEFCCEDFQKGLSNPSTLCKHLKCIFIWMHTS